MMKIRLLLPCLFMMVQVVHGQDIAALKKLKDPKALIKGKGLSINGALSANYSYYQAFDITERRIPLNYMYTGNLVFDVFGKFKMPLSFSYSNQKATFTNGYVNPFQGLNAARFRQPFNRFVIKPTYKGFTLQTGTVALNFSPYTLANYRYDGVGFTYKSAKVPIYGGIMYGNLKRATKIDTLNPALNKPSYKRFGMGIQLGYKKDKNAIELILFKAVDDLKSLPYTLDKFNINPQSNVVGSIKVAKEITKKILFNAELANSGITSDSRAETRNNINFLRTYAGLLAVNTTTKYTKSIKSTLAYNADAYTAELEYSRVDPHYKTFGAYFFNNDLETFSIKGSTQIMDKKVSLVGSVGRQQDNLDKTKFQTTKRWATLANVIYAPTEKLNFNVTYSTFLNHSNLISNLAYLTSVTPYDALDTLDYRQINNSTTGIVTWELPSSSKDLKKNVGLNLIYQSNKDIQKGSNQNLDLLNSAFNFGINNTKKKMTMAAGINYTINHTADINSNLLGPSFSFSKEIKDLQLSLNLVYSNSINKKQETLVQHLSVLNNRLGINYTYKKNHKFQFALIYLKSNTVKTETRQFSELTATLGYKLNLKMLDLKFK